MPTQRFHHSGRAIARDKACFSIGESQGYNAARFLIGDINLPVIGADRDADRVGYAFSPAANFSYLRIALRILYKQNAIECAVNDDSIQTIAKEGNGG